MKLTNLWNPLRFFFFNEEIFEFNSQEEGKLFYKCDNNCTIQNKSYAKKGPMYLRHKIYLPTSNYVGMRRTIKLNLVQVSIEVQEK